MKNLPNIEKHPFSTEYLGYDGNGYAWSVGKSKTSYGNWCATSKHFPNRHVFAWRLTEMSKKLTEFKEAKQ